MKVKTADGEKNVEEVNTGDYVLSEDPETGEQEYKEVVRTFIHVKWQLVHVTIDDEGIETTTEHPFYVEGIGFVPAKDLQPGDIIRTSDGRNLPIQKVEIEELEEPVLVYNFEVEDYHTYYVSELGVLVHNMCCGETGAVGVMDGTTSNGILALPAPGDISKSSRRVAAEQKLADAASGVNNKVVDPLTGMEVNRLIADSHGNIMIEPIGGKTIAAGRNGVDTHTLYPNGSNYQRYNPVGHGNNTTPHGHGHLMGTGPGRKGQGASIDIFGNIVPFNSSDDHWTIH